MEFLGFKSKGWDPDVWMSPDTKNDGTEAYEYVFLYTDDCLVVSENTESILKNEIGRYFGLKPDSIGTPSLYLGGHLRKIEFSNGVEAWAFSSTHYVKTAVKNVEKYLVKKDQSLKAKALDPLPKGYRPEIDVLEELRPEEAYYYMSLIGIFWWMV